MDGTIIFCLVLYEILGTAGLVWAVIAMKNTLSDAESISPTRYILASGRITSLFGILLGSLIVYAGALLYASQFSMTLIICLAVTDATAAAVALRRFTKYKRAAIAHLVKMVGESRDRKTGLY